MYDIYFDLANMHRTVEESDHAEQLDLFTGAEMGMGFDFDWISDLPKENFELTDGQTCKQCGDFYPYADRPNQKDGTFKGWGCRHYW